MVGGEQETNCNDLEVRENKGLGFQGLIEEYNYQSQPLPPLRLPTLVLLHDISVHF